MKSIDKSTTTILDSRSETNDTIDNSTKITLAKMSHRYYAWLIDYVIIFSIGLVVFLAIKSASIFVSLYGNFQYPKFFEYGLISIVFFLYWLILESKTGQSIGKMVLRLKITNLSGEAADFKSIAISSFGKAFLLPIDVIIGRIFTNQKRQRIFNRLGNTIVIKIEDVENEPDNITYKKD